ncbi:TIGR04282 family arsenosugar biosynthesis glycosyltransferase [Actinokineospora sp. G85]|uniref:TIGR04282 family arsenosugar biosynthesis glycosyltransferase n=1 Tax=Actinokineospora sp. G85 TaxID=3406626 RepID=UPI003C72E703
MTCLLVVAKAPVPGLAKTRLTPPATEEQAADIAAAALLDTLDAVLATPGARPVVAMTGDLRRARRGQEIADLLAGCTVFDQHGNGFAERLAGAHADVADAFPDEAVFQIGMDTPQVSPALLAEALDALRDGEGALGRALDGGWWGLGLRDPRQAKALATVPMSRADTADLTIAALAGAGVRLGELPVLSDVDTIEDALRVAAGHPGGRFARAVAALAA